MPSGTKPLPEPILTKILAIHVQMHLKNSLQWRHNERDGISNHLCLHCLLNCWFRRRSKKTSKLCVTGLWEGNSLATDEFPAQKASNAENVSIWWRHHVTSHINSSGRATGNYQKFYLNNENLSDRIFIFTMIWGPSSCSLVANFNKLCHIIFKYQYQIYSEFQQAVSYQFQVSKSNIYSHFYF